jgi:hypothetical protein
MQYALCSDPAVRKSLSGLPLSLHSVHESPCLLRDSQDLAQDELTRLWGIAESASGCKDRAGCQERPLLHDIGQIQTRSGFPHPSTSCGYRVLSIHVTRPVFQAL